MARAGGIHIVDLVDDVEHFRNTRTRRNMYRLQEAGLRSILLREDLRGLPVALVSVAGAFRGGKSFLLNYFIRYLTATPMGRADGSWVGAAGQPLSGFDWAPGIERSTTGIQLWPEPFFIQKNDGTRVAVLLMDTQGTFDSHSSLRDSSTIFALSTLLSSLQVYNLKYHINDCDLINLEAFTKYGTFMKEAAGEALQELKFLVRDWENNWELPYGDGDEGGARYKRIKLQVTESQPEQANRIRENITSSFEVISCFLMPHPGRNVSKPSFKSNPGDLEPDFKTELVKLTHSIFSPENLRIKLLGGQPVTAEVLFGLIRTYVDSFNSDDLPEPRTIYEAQSEASLEMAMNAALDLFESRMRQETALSMPETVLIQLHEHLLNEVMTSFESKRLLGQQVIIDNRRRELRTNLANRLENMKTTNNGMTVTAVNNANAAYDAVIERLRNNQRLCVHVLHLKNAHDEGLAAATRTFDGSRKRLANGQVDPNRQQLLADCEARYRSNVRLNEFHNQAFADELLNEYQTFMMGLCNQNTRLNDVAFEAQHQAQLARALAQFEQRRNRPNQYRQDTLKEQLIQKIEENYPTLKENNKSQNAARAQLAYLEYRQGLVTVEGLRSRCLHPQALNDLHRQGIDRALGVYCPGRSADQGFNLSNPDERTIENYIMSSESESDIESNSKSESKYESDSEPNSKHESDSDSEPESNSEPDSKYNSESHSETESELSELPNADLPDETDLFQLIRNHYDTLVDINKSANENAVEAAFKAYKDKFANLTDYFGYFAASWDTVKRYHEEALDVAHDVFFSKRRSRNTYGDDPCIKLLDGKCERHYNPEGQTQHGFAKFMGEWGAAMEQITRDEYLTLPDD